ncbi:MAG TPA: MarR family transcriptional regulator [Ilumatobacteraceae bacterium]|nr:MarR family transcriptional regulator [Ilumatobacteraceae bacterium]
MATRWLSDDEQTAWRAVTSMSARLSARLQRDLQAQSGISEADYAVLVALSEAAEGRLRPYELGRATRWEKSRLSHHLRRMIARGLVERHDCPTDARGAFVTLTPAGHDTIEQAAPLHVESVRAAFVDSLTADELHTFGELAARIAAHLGDDGDCSCDN